MKQLCILDCDDSLGGEILNSFDLFIGERPGPPRDRRSTDPISSLSVRNGTASIVLIPAMPAKGGRLPIRVILVRG